MGRHPPCDALMESPNSAIFEGIGSSVPRLYHRKELTNVHAKWVVVLIFRCFLSSGFYGRHDHWVIKYSTAALYLQYYKQMVIHFMTVALYVQY